LLDRAVQDRDAAPRLRPLCRHCGLPSPLGAAYCCPGCEAIAAALAGRALPPVDTRSPGIAADLAHYDDPAVSSRFVRDAGEGLVEALFVVEGLRCGACAWLAERAVSEVPGVELAEASFSTSRLYVRWKPGLAPPSRILAAARGAGYDAWPCDERRLQQSESRERRSLLRRFLVAALAMMQVMMYAVPAYIAGEGDITPDIASLLRWAGLVLTTPVIAYCAYPIFAGAWRDARHARLGMDAPVALGLAAAFAASVQATIAGAGDVYFDSVAMFVFLVTGARYLEMTARHRAGRTLARLARLAPEVAHRIEPSGTTLDIPVAMVRSGDRLQVRPGETVPADGTLEGVSATLDESLLTGESRAVSRRPGEALAGGAVSAGAPFTMRVTRSGAESTLASIERLMERAMAARSPSLDLAQRAARYATFAIVAAAALSGLAWLAIDPARALPVAIAVLIITCPCALSIAAPVALTLATGRLARERFVVTRGHAIEALATATDVVFDKTGTLTLATPRLAEVVPLGARGDRECLALAAALAQASSHPLDAAIRESARGLALPDVGQVDSIAGQGLSACGAHRVRLGGMEFAQAVHGRPAPVAWLACAGTVAWLADELGWIAALRFGEEERQGAREALAKLRAEGRRLHLLSGDSPQAVRPLAERLGIDTWEAGASPARKLEYVRDLQSHGARVAMVGDGVNDAPVLAQADVSIAMGGGADLAQLRADAVLLSGSLADLGTASTIARRARRVMAQNVAWALAYNAIAVPLAIAGLVTPLVAGIGMAASSLVVVANALRLSR